MEFLRVKLAELERVARVLVAADLGDSSKSKPETEACYRKPHRILQMPGKQKTLCRKSVRRNVIPGHEGHLRELVRAMRSSRSTTDQLIETTPPSKRNSAPTIFARLYSAGPDTRTARGRRSLHCNGSKASKTDAALSYFSTARAKSPLSKRASASSKEAKPLASVASCTLTHPSADDAVDNGRQRAVPRQLKQYRSPLTACETHPPLRALGRHRDRSDWGILQELVAVPKRAVIAAVLFKIA